MTEPHDPPLMARPQGPQQPPVHDVPGHQIPQVAPAGPKFVVLHEGLGPWRAGDVISTAHLEKIAPGQIERLLGLKAMRPADHVESLQTSVKVVKEGEKNLSYESMVVDRDKALDKLKMENATLRNEVDTVKRGGHAPSGEGAEKDRQIEDLKHKLAEAQEAQGQIREGQRGKR